MSPRDEEAVERYVRYPDTLSDAERIHVADLLRSDPTARRLAAFYRSFYQELDGLDDPLGSAGQPSRDDES